MTSLVEVPVIKAFTHEGRAFHPGDTARVRPVVAAALHYQGLVSLTRDYRTAVLPAESDKVAPRRRRTYRRRDMVAE